MQSASSSFQSTSFEMVDWQLSVLKLNSWPPLTSIPGEYVHHVSRICALLRRRPTSPMLMVVILGLPKELVYTLLDEMYVYGHVVATNVKASHETYAPNQWMDSEEVRPSSVRAFLHRIWLRLTE